jgi:hypothetical protein
VVEVGEDLAFIAEAPDNEIEFHAAPDLPNDAVGADAPPDLGVLVIFGLRKRARGGGRGFNKLAGLLVRSQQRIDLVPQRRISGSGFLQ